MKRKIIIASVTLVAGLAAIGVFYGGVLYGGSQRAVVITDSNEILDADISLFWDAIDLVKHKYVNIEEVSDQDILYGAIHGAVNALGDPYSAFLEPSDAEKFEQDLAGNFGGIGAQIGMREGQVVVVTPLKNNPADQAGLKAGDKILRVDDTLLTGLSVEEAVKLIRGEIGTNVRLLILRDGWEEAKEFTIARQNIEVPTLDWKMLDGKIAHIALYNFNANAPSLFYQASLDALIQGARGVVFDLRGNPGGFLDVANHISGWFVGRGSVVVRERFYSGDERPFLANGNEAFTQMPVVLLVDGGSASAAEIVAGALRDNRNIPIVGERTFGKGTVQEVDFLKDGSTIKISIAEWVTPNGSRIDQEGLEPDIQISLPDDWQQGDPDLQLERAVNVLRDSIAKQENKEGATIHIVL